MSLIVGTLVALLSSLVPAIRATRVSPMASLRTAAVQTVGHVNRRLTIFAAVLTIGGIALILLGLLGSGSSNSKLLELGIGVITLFIAVAAAQPLARAPAGVRDGLARRAVRRIPRAARARERDPAALTAPLRRRRR